MVGVFGVLGGLVLWWVFVILVFFMRQHVGFDRGIVFHVMSVAYIVCRKASQLDFGHLTLSILRLAALDEAHKTHNTKSGIDQFSQTLVKNV